MRIRLKLFARYAELLGASEVSLELPAGATVRDAIECIRSGHPNGRLLPERPLVAVNLNHVLPDRPLDDGDELAVMPPLAGG